MGPIYAYHGDGALATLRDEAQQGGHAVERTASVVPDHSGAIGRHVQRVAISLSSLGGDSSNRNRDLVCALGSNNTTCVSFKISQ